MKILHIIHAPPLGRRGMETNVFQISAQMAKEGHDVTILSGIAIDQSYAESLPDSEFVTKEGIRIVIVDELHEIDKFIKESDIVNLHFTFSYRASTPYVLKYCVKHNIKCYVTIHTNPQYLLSYTGIERTAAEKERILKEVVELLSAPNIYLICPSINTCANLEELGVRNKCTNIVYPGAKLRSTPRKLEIEPVDLTFIGWMVPLKGIEYLLKAIKIVKKKVTNVKVRLVGGGDIEYYQRKIKRMGLKDSIILEGFIPHNQVPKYLEKTRILVHPSLSETWCIAVEEALFKEVPVIATQVEGLYELTQKGKFACLVPTRSVKRLANAIEKYLTNSEAYSELKSMAKQGYKFVHQECTIKAQTQKLINIYKNGKI
jgi:glycosyltransferase involved in cell wall biosynthesis